MSKVRKKKVYENKPPFSRLRTRFALKQGTIAQQWRQWSTCSEPNYVPNETGIYPTLGSFEYMRDTVVPGYHRRVAAGEKFFNDMWRERYQYEDLGGYGGRLRTLAVSCSPNYSYRDNRGNWIPRLLPKQAALQQGLEVITTEDPVSNADKISLQKEISTRMLNDRGRGESNLFESLAEAHQTVGLLKLLDWRYSRISQLLREVARAKRQGRFPGYAANGMSNLWLAYRYGIKPLINDIDAIVEGLQKSRGIQKLRTRAKGNIHKGVTDNVVLSYGYTEITCKRTIDSDYTVRAMSLDEADMNVFDNIGFTGKGLVTVPWELVSHSFVADWFVNIGDFLGAITPAFGWNNIGSTLTCIYGVLTTYEVQSSRATGSVYTMDIPANGKFRVHFLSRSRQPVLPPSLVIKSDFRFDKFTRAADAYTLLGKQVNAVFGSDQFQRTFRPK